MSDGQITLAWKNPTIRPGNEILTAAVTPPSVRNASAEMGGQLLALAATWAWSVASV